MRLRPRSVRLRLTLWYAGALAVILLVFAVGVYACAHKSLTAQPREQLAGDLAAIRRLTQHDPDELEELEEHGVTSLFRVDEDGTLLFQTAGWLRLGLNDSAYRLRAGQEASFRAVDGRHYRVQVAAFQIAGRAYRLAAATNEEPIRRALQDLLTVLLVGYPVGVILAVAGGYLLAGRFLSPVGAMADKACQISAERLSERLPVENPDDEFGRLATVFNDTLARLEGSFQRLRRFTADASHELRTPLTALRSVGEVALHDRQEVAAYRDAIGSMLEEVDRLTRLIESLLMLTRADTGKAALKREPVDAAALVADVVEHLRPLAEEKSQIIEWGGPGMGRASGPPTTAPELTVSADRVTLRHALVNLLDNAIKYSPAGGTVRVEATRDADGDITIAVSDDGPGIQTAEQEKIFERFYRIDKARSGQTSGVGLGLSIARWAVEANGGRIEVVSAEGRGSTFRIVLPAT